MEYFRSISGKIKKVIKVSALASYSSDVEGFKLGAVIFDKHKIYAYASNSEKANPLQKQYNRFKQRDSHLWLKHSGHAEINCIHRLLQQYYDDLPDTNKLSILVYREHADGSFAMARPCPACRAAIKKMGIKHVYYTGEKSLIYEEFTE